MGKRAKIVEKGQQFFEAMPATMEKATEKIHDQQWRQRNAGWLLVPAALLTVTSVVMMARTKSESDITEPLARDQAEE